MFSQRQMYRVRAPLQRPRTLSLSGYCEAMLLVLDVLAETVITIEISTCNGAHDAVDRPSNDSLGRFLAVHFS